MKIPRKIQVLNCVYLVKRKKNFSKETGYDGLCDGNEKVILVDADLKGEDLIRTLFHEIFHAHQVESGLNEILDHQAKEMAAETSAAMICDILYVKFK